MANVDDTGSGKASKFCWGPARDIRGRSDQGSRERDDQGSRGPKSGKIRDLEG